MENPQHVLITGTSSGFGFLTAQTLLKKGHIVIAAMRGLETKNAGAARKLDRMATEVGATLHLLEMDVTDTTSVNAAVRQALASTGRIDVAVNNAGYGVGGLAETVTDEQMQRQFDVNVFGVQRVMRAVLPSMRQQRQGLIINISSVMGRIVIPFAAAYTASKWALEGLSESYRYELAATGVDVVLVEPGGFGTNFMENMDSGADAERLETYGRLAKLPEEMWSGMSAQMTQPDGPDPQEVADAVADLIHTPAGRRPLRTVVDPMTGGQAPRHLNRESDNIQEKLLADLGIKALGAAGPGA